MTKDLTYYINLNYPVTLERDVEDGEIYYSAEIPDLPGCGSSGKTIDEALEKLQEAKEAWIEVSLERNLSIPEPVSENDFSGKFLLRIPTKLHMALSKLAKSEGISLNQYIKSILEIHTTLTFEQQNIKSRDEKLLTILKSMEHKIEKLEREIESLKETVKTPITKEELITAEVTDEVRPILVPPGRFMYPLQIGRAEG